MGTACCRSEDLPQRSTNMEVCAEERFPVDSSECQLQPGHEEASEQAAEPAQLKDDESVVPSAAGADVPTAQAGSEGVVQTTEVDIHSGSGVVKLDTSAALAPEETKEGTLIGEADDKATTETVKRAVVQTDVVEVIPDKESKEEQEKHNEKPVADAKKAIVKNTAAKKKEDAKKKAAAQKKKAEEDAKRQAAEAAQRAIEDEENRKREGQQKARARKKTWKSIDPAKQKDMIAKLCEAAAKGDVSVLLQLLDEHVDVDVFGPKGEYMTPLHFACEAGHAEFTKALIVTAGADPCGTIKASANTPLHLAALNNHADCCEIVGVPRALTLKNGQGKTPRDLAEAAGAKAALKALRHLAKKH
mmetsp:Transcript_150665/g.280921  ORF Transcript_150665/g.280921 Transcript_150665/m.280921 type:complete len:360 (-) Transcript_150665:182-1261(-)